METLRVETERRPGSRVRLKVDVPADYVDRSYRRTAQAFAREAALPGFRKGKAPPALVEDRFRDRILKETLDEIIPHAIGHALEREGLEPHWYGEVTHPPLALGADLPIEVEVEVRPRIDPQGYHAIRVQKPRVTVSPDEVEKALEEVRERHAEWNAVERPAARGDMVVVDFEATDTKDGAPVPGGRAENYDVVLGAGTSVPGFEEALEGAAAGEVRTFGLRFPDDHPDERLRGRPAEFRATVRAVKRKVLPALDDDLARDAGAESLADLRAKIEARIREVREAEAEAEVEEQILEALVAANPIDDVPATLVEEEVDRQIMRLFRRLQAAGIPPAAFMKERNLDAEGLRREVRPRAEAAVRAFLVASGIARKEGITVTDEEVWERLKRIASVRREDPRKFARRLAEEGRIRRVREEMAVERALLLVRERAVIIEGEEVSS